MPVKIRLQRHGKKGYAYFHIVATDSRSKRDGRCIERIGIYNPNTNPATIQLDNAAALRWLSNGAQPTDTARAILSYKGVMYKQHLMKGVTKGAFTVEEAESKWQSWSDQKEAKVQAKRDNLSKAQQDALATRLADERKVNQTREREAAAKLAAVETVEVDTVEPAAEVVVEVVADEVVPEIVHLVEAPVESISIAEPVVEPTVEVESAVEAEVEAAAAETLESTAAAETSEGEEEPKA